MNKALFGVIEVTDEDSAHPGATAIPEKEGDNVKVTISLPAYISAEDLCRALGHEMVHVRHLIKGGLFWNWYREFADCYGDSIAKQMAKCISEMHAHMWEIAHGGDYDYNVAWIIAWHEQYWYWMSILEKKCP